ncbi:MAG: hypothetical protein R2710_13805 [Acidimicrobiales bacterium]
MTWRGRFLLAFVVVVLAAELAARATIAATDAPVLRWHDDATQLKVAQMDERGPVDMVIVGTSMAQQDIVPSVLAAALSDDTETHSRSTTALNGGVPVVMEPWLLDQVVDRLQPDTVVWGLSALDLSLEYGDATLDAYEQALETKSGVYATADRWASRLSVLMADRRVLRDPDQLVGDGADRNRRRLADARAEVGPDGERQNFTVDTGIRQSQEIARRITPFQLDRDDLAAIVRTVDALRERGIEVVFVELPVPNRFRQLYPGGPDQHDLVNATLTELARELDVEFITPEVTFTDPSFVDFTHLNAESAKSFTESLATSLQN